MDADESVLQSGIRMILYYQQTFPESFAGISPNAHEMRFDHITEEIETCTTTTILLLSGTAKLPFRGRTRTQSRQIPSLVDLAKAQESRRRSFDVPPH